MTFSIRSTITLLCLVIISIVFMTTSGRTAQEGERTVEKQSFNNEPVKINTVKAKKSDVVKDIIVGKNSTTQMTG